MVQLPGQILVVVLGFVVILDNGHVKAEVSESVGQGDIEEERVFLVGYADDRFVVDVVPVQAIGELPRVYVDAHDGILVGELEVARRLKVGEEGLDRRCGREDAERESPAGFEAHGAGPGVAFDTLADGFEAVDDGPKRLGRRELQDDARFRKRGRGVEAHV